MTKNDTAPTTDAPATKLTAAAMPATRGRLRVATNVTAGTPHYNKIKW